jgi:hypothetical protein
VSFSLCAFFVVRSIWAEEREDDVEEVVARDINRWTSRHIWDGLVLKYSLILASFSEKLL